MSDWRPAPNRDVDVRELPMGPEEGYVLSRLDGHTPLEELGHLTGLPEERLRAIMRRLVELGAIQPPPSSSPATSPSPTSSSPPTSPPPSPLPLGEGQGEGDVPPEDELPEQPEDETHALSARGLFETQLRALPAAERHTRAKESDDPILSALCFDPLPSVVRALLENPRLAPKHARLLARHHRHPVGLEALASRATLARDPQVDRWLLRNPQLPQGLARRMLAARRMLVLHKLVVDREVPELTRRAAGEALRQRFATGQAEERAGLLFATEGRVLVALVGIPVDGHTAALLCHHTYRSTLFIQNLARWGACPPSVIAHLLRQELVRRQPTLRAMLERHPNAPSEARRG
ncbi:MAG: hypothetical protein L0Y66_04980 [Myxococcaceae bacterium]|nr:hypothetical protein [Myxococcaceae bacterium]MCI0672664.1 hypothetical protein [Myxococcaceae bacterium]